MPGNGAEDRIHNLFEADNSFQGHYLSQTVDDNWSLLNCDEWVGQQNQIGVSLNPSLKNYRGQQLESIGGLGNPSLCVPFDQSYAQLSQRFDCSRSDYSNLQLNSNGFTIRCQNFPTRQIQPAPWNENALFDRHNLTSKSFLVLQSQQEYEPLDSPTLTTNSERSEITEASSDFNFHQGHQQLARCQQPGIPQTYTMQQSGYNDTQLLQQHMMLKQLQELQRQQQLQQLGDMRQQNSLSQLSAVAKPAGGQFSPLINGTPVHDGSQMFMNWVQRGVSPAAQGASNRGVFSQEQSLALRSMGLVTQQLDASLYGAPIASARGNMNQYAHAHLQGTSHDSVNLLTKAGGQSQKSTMQSSGFSNPFMRDQSTVSANQVCMPQGAITSNQGFQGKNMFGQVPFQGLNNGIMADSLQETNLRMSTSLKELNARQEQAAWPVMQQKTTQVGPPQGLVPLDPIEEKILYNMDDNVWDPAFGRRPDVGAEGISNSLECSDLSNAFPSLQSGSWSALMQSAVAEASSGDTGMQEEWSGLTFQNTEQSTDNQMLNFMDTDKQPTGWVDNNLQSASSFNSKPAPLFSDSSMNSSFPGFQQPGIQPSVGHTEGLPQDGSHDSIQKTHKDTGLWFDGNAQQKTSIEGSQQSQSFINIDTAWASQIYDCSETDTQQERVTSFNDVTQPHYKGDANESMYRGKDADTHFWKTDGEYGVSTFTRPTGVEQVHSALQHREDSQMKSFAALQSSNAAKVHYVTSQPSNDYMEHVNAPTESKVKETMGYNQHQINNGPHGFCGAYEGAHEIYEKQQNLDKECLPDFQGTSKASEELRSRADFRSVASDGSNVAAETRQNILELFHKVDQPREDGSATHFGSTDSNQMSNVPGLDNHTSATQLYSHRSASQGFNLGLALPSQRLQNSNQFLTSQGLHQTLGYLNSRQVDTELREKSQPWVAPASSVQCLSTSPELSQRAIWDNKSAALGEVGVSSYMNMQGSSVPTFSSAPQHTRNQSQMPFMSNVRISSRTEQSTLPVLEAIAASQPSVPSSMPQQGDFLARPQNVWVNAPLQRHSSGLEPLKVTSNLTSSMVPSNTDLITPSKVGYQISDIGACSMNSVSFNSGGEQPGKVNSQQQTSSQMPDISQRTDSSQGQEYLAKHSSDANALSSGSLVAPSHEEDLDKVRPNDNHLPAPVERNLEGFGHSLKTSHHQNYSLLHQVQAMDKGLNSASELNSVPPGDPKTLSFSTHEREEDPSAKSSLQPTLQNILSHGINIFGQNDSHRQSGCSNMVSGHTEHGQVNLPMASPWFKQFALKNGQMLPMYDARMAKAAAAQFSLGKPSQNLSMHTSVDHDGAAHPSHGGTARPSSAATLVENKQLSAPYVLPLDVVNQGVSIMRPKKRKIAISELLPWHKEVEQGSQRLQNIRMAEQDWAQATNQLIEKVDNDTEMLEDVQPSVRSKRRIILTTELMQQLLRPAPAFISSADAIAHYDGVSYFVSRLAVGDACSLTYYTRNELPVLLENSNMVSAKLRTRDQHFSEAVEGLSDRVKKLENEFQRLDKAASILDLRVECQELERFAVINRFAKFHSRGPADNSGTSSSTGAPKPPPQRYVTALTMPRKLPEGLQCLSL